MYTYLAQPTKGHVFVWFSATGAISVYDPLVEAQLGVRDSGPGEEYQESGPGKWTAVAHVPHAQLHRLAQQQRNLR